MNISSIQYASACCTIVSSLLSIFGAFVIFLTYWRVSFVRNFPRTLLTWLTFADLLIASGNLSGSIDFLSTEGTDNDVCNVQSYVTTFASMASFLWTLVITVHMMVSIQFRSDMTRSAVLKVLYHVICWGIPGVITLVAGLHGVLGLNSDTNATNTAVTGTWCWIKDMTPDSERIKWMLLTGKGWEIPCYILSLSILVLLKLKLYLSRRRLRELEGDFRDEDIHYLYLWLVLWLLRVWGTIRFLLLWLGKDDAIDFLLILHSIGDSGQAFGNCVLFCFLDREVRRYLRTACISCHYQGAEYQRLITPTEVSANSDNRSIEDAV